MVRIYLDALTRSIPFAIRNLQINPTNPIHTMPFTGYIIITKIL